MDVPEPLRSASDALYKRANERLDSIIAGLEVDFINRDETDDPLAWLLSQRWMKDNLTPAYMIELITTALYRIARQNLATQGDAQS